MARDISPDTEGQPRQDEASLASFRIECRAEDVEFDPANAWCSYCTARRARWWVGEEPTCTDCIPARLGDGPSVVVPITSLPMPPIDDCIAHRCAKHLSIPVQNRNESGAECGGCIAERVTALYAAVKYALDRAQTDADFGYVAGVGTEMFRRFCIAEAAYSGKLTEDIELLRAETRWRERPRIPALRERVEELENRLGSRQ